MAWSSLLIVLLVSCVFTDGQVQRVMRRIDSGEARSIETEPQSAEEGEGTTVEYEDNVLPTTPCEETTEYPTCPITDRCGFQQYIEETRRPIGNFIKYCTCPEGMECRRIGEHMSQRFWFYKCANVTVDAPADQTDDTTTSPLSEGSSAAPSHEDL